MCVFDLKTFLIKFYFWIVPVDASYLLSLSLSLTLNGDKFNPFIIYKKKQQTPFIFLIRIQQQNHLTYISRLKKIQIIILSFFCVFNEKHSEFKVNMFIKISRSRSPMRLKRVYLFLQPRVFASWTWLVLSFSCPFFFWFRRFIIFVIMNYCVCFSSLIR